MAMQVILKEDVHNLGKAGELVKVKPGFGRNYLIPQGKAIVATAANVKEIEHQKKVIAAKQAQLSKDAQSMADKLASVDMIQWWRDVGGTAVSFGSDAHLPQRVGDRFKLAVDVVEAAGFRPGHDPYDFWRV